MSFPRLLLISDVAFSKDGFGINRTLVSLFEDYPQDRMMLLLPECEEACATKHQVLRFTAPRLPGLSNRIGQWLEPAARYINLSFAAHQMNLDWQRLTEFSPELAIVCANRLEALLSAETVLKKLRCPFVLYLMDDWRDSESQHWWGGYASSTFRYLFSKASSVIAVSSALIAELEQRYGTRVYRSRVQHHMPKIQSVLASETPQDAPLLIGYAGSLWGMHYDSIELLAKACLLLRQRGVEIQFKVFSDVGSWAQRANELSALEVEYGGFLPYEKLHAGLVPCSLLLVACSFLPKFLHLSRTSVQTKITDYMAVGRAVLCLSPPDSASAEFVRNQKCGFCISETDSTRIADELHNILRHPGIIHEAGSRGRRMVEESLNHETQAKQLRTFLNQCLNPNS